MKLIRGLKNLPKPLAGCVMTIGNFDGVHKGHQAVIDQVLDLAKQQHVASLVMLFEPQPLEFFAPEKAPKRLYRLREKIVKLQQLGIDYLFCVPFNQQFADLTAQQFVVDYLVNALQVRHLVVGDDFCFGKNRQGNFELLQQMGLRYDFAVQNTHSIKQQGQRISSTLIRHLIANNQFAEASELLGQPYALNGKVCHGKKLGREIGFPTINIRAGHLALAVAGIFAVHVKGLDNAQPQKPYQGVASVGTRPTVNGKGVLIEVYIFDFNQDVYGKHVCIEFLSKLRAEEKFVSIEVLVEHIQQDVKKAQAFFATNEIV